MYDSISCFLKNNEFYNSSILINMLTSNISLANKTVFITGVAGFIGSYLAQELLKRYPTLRIVGIDSITDYYDTSLKEERLRKLEGNSNFRFYKGSIADKELVNRIFTEEKPNIVVNLAAQAGVRYSITNPDAYIESNLIGFYNLLEALATGEVSPTECPGGRHLCAWIHDPLGSTTYYDENGPDDI